MIATRRNAREWAVQMLTSLDLNQTTADLSEVMAAYWEQLGTLDGEDGAPDEKVRGKLKRFAEERVEGVWTKKAEIDEELVRHLADWDLYRLGTVERSVLRLGCWEIKYSDVPKPVVINEAIDLANWFSTPKSRTLVNAVLDKIEKP